MAITKSNTRMLEGEDLTLTGNILVGVHTNTHSPVSDGGEGVTLMPNGQILAGGQYPSYFNREDSDGDIVVFRKDGTAVGNIGVQGRMYMAGTAMGIYFGPSYLAPTNSSGTVTDNTYDLGDPSYRWDDIYATNGTIQTSDANEKQDIEALSEAEQRVAVACKGLLRKFRWKSSVEENGDDARIHFGIIAQDLQAAFEAEGLDAGSYAMFTSATWTDEDSGEEKTRLGVRYAELLAFIISAI